MDKRPPTLLEKTREVLRLKPYAQTTEESYTDWVAFVRIDWWVRSRRGLFRAKRRRQRGESSRWQAGTCHYLRR
jgi:hypothetical protein